jgi:hypothetical protein
LNKKGQFSIIAALLVAIVLISTVIMTYSTIRNSTIHGQPQILSAIDETNLATKQILGFTVGYYGSVLKSTGNQTYATELATNYLQSGLVYTANMHPDWGASFDVTNSQLITYWYSNASYSSGSLSISYNLTGLGIYGITYETSCGLKVQVLPSVNNKAILGITKDENEPLINLAKKNLKFYRYEASDSLWHLAEPPNEPLAYSNGTYQIDLPSGIDVNSYMIQAEDQRGIMVIASSFSQYDINLAWNTLNATSTLTYHYVDNNVSDVDGSSNKGTESNFTAMRYGPDSIVDTLTEGITTPAGSERWVSPISFEGSGWTSPSNAYDNDTSTRASISFGSKTWSAYLRLTTSAVSSHMIHYYIGRSDNQVDQVQIDIYNGAWISVYNGAGTWGAWVNVSYAETSVSKVRFRFYNNHGSQSRAAYVHEAQFLQTGTQQNCELDVEAQWTSVNYTDPNQWLCIYGGTMASEDIRVDVRNGSTWLNLLNDLSTGWNNVSVSQYVSSSMFTIRFKGGTETTDSLQSSWQIDAALLRSGAMGVSSDSGTVVVELLQNGTMRWLGENLQQTMQAKPIPPIPVKSIHVNETVANVSSEVPFQTEDWASDYRIPLGLANNASVFSNRNMLVFLANPNVSKITMWWNGSDTTTQTPNAFTNRYFTGDDVANGVLTNGILSLRIGSGFRVTSTQGTSTAVAVFMRINGQNSTYGAGSAYAIHHGIVRDIVHQEAEWSNGAPNCPNLYAHIVLTLPANVTYYTYQLRLMFVDSTQSRTITDLCPLRLSVPTGQPQTENGTSGDYPVPSSNTGLFYNSSLSESAHHWSQFTDGTKGAGIMFTDKANEQLYAFDSIAAGKTGAISVSNSTGNLIELRPITMQPVSFTYALDIVWHGAIATFDATMPIYRDSAGVVTGLWTTVELLPIITVTTS